MIRDPSDGTVKEPPKPVLETGTSGLPAGKSKDLARLEYSREWLKKYHERKASHEGQETDGSTD